MIEFLSPLGWLVACAALLPIVAAMVRDRRERRVRAALGLLAPGSRTRFATAAAAVLAVACLAAATAKPAIRTSGAGRLRTDAQVYFLVDISRSMVARHGQHGRTRFARALSAAAKIRAGLADVPAGVASLTDRPLPHLFPTANQAVFSSVLHRVLGIERPPPEGSSTSDGTTTSFDPIVQFSTASFFSPTTPHKLVILLSDGESDSYSPRAIGTQLRARHIGLLVVRFWRSDERVYSGGRQERYRPDPGSLAALQLLAAQTSHRPVFGEDDSSRVAHAAHDLLGSGPTIAAGRPRRVELARYAALAALLPVAFMVRRRDR
jgi:hypothetical protein